MRKLTSLILKAAKPPLITLIITALIISLANIYFDDIIHGFYNYAISITSGYLFTLIILGTVSWFSFRFINLYSAYLKQNSDGKISNIAIILPIIRNTLIIAVVLVLANLILPALPLPDRYAHATHNVLTVLLIIALTWLCLKITLTLERIVIIRYSSLVDEDIKARTTYTKAYIFKNIVTYLILILAVASILMTFENVRQLGISILTSLTFLTAIVGLAAQRTLATLFFGLQIALTQPIRIGDAVIIENEFGKIEEITLTYVTIRLWDLRRLIVPITYFLDKPIQNWTKNSKKLIGVVMLYVDYTIPTNEIRVELQKILQASNNWDKNTGMLHVTDAKEKTVELRIIASAPDADKTFELRCEIREKLLAYIAANYPNCLPKTRLARTKYCLSPKVGWTRRVFRRNPP